MGKEIACKETAAKGTGFLVGAGDRPGGWVWF